MSPTTPRPCLVAVAVAVAVAVSVVVAVAVSVAVAVAVAAERQGTRTARGKGYLPEIQPVRASACAAIILWSTLSSAGNAAARGLDLDQRKDDQPFSPGPICAKGKVFGGPMVAVVALVVVAEVVTMGMVVMVV